MSQTIQACFRPLTTFNRRISIGGGVLSLMLIGESMMFLIRPLT